MDRKARLRALVLAAAKARTAQALSLAADEQQHALFAPYSPSPERVIDAVWARFKREHVALAPDELLVDLGCGDGRWLVSGVQQLGCRALGIELDPALVRVANDKVESARLSDRIQVVEADIMAVPIRDARLVIVYAFAEALHGIREYLIDQLRPNAMVLSVGFRMPNWKPRWTDQVGGLRLYFYELYESTPLTTLARDGLETVSTKTSQADAPAVV